MTAEPADAPDWASPEEAKVLRSFFENGLLDEHPGTTLEAAWSILHQLADTVFEKKHKYPEKEVNQRLGAVYPDPASLRRYLVDEGFMARKNGEYRLRPRSIGLVPSASRKRLSARARAPAPTRPTPEPRRAPRHSRRAWRRWS